MKTIYVFVLTCIIFIFSGFSIHKTSRTIILQPADRNVSSEMISVAGRIISGRLKTYDPGESFNVATERNQIIVQIPDNLNLSEIEELLTSKGDPGFYETITLKEIADLSKKEFSGNSSEARLACSAFEKKNVVDSVGIILKSVNLLSDCKLLWGFKNDKSLKCLYAVKTKPALTKADIESVNSLKADGSQSVSIGIKFKQASVKTWSAFTAKCLNKPVAIVIDNKVFFTPVVRITMENGLCEITGNFTQKDTNYFVALIGNDILPVSLTVK